MKNDEKIPIRYGRGRRGKTAPDQLKLPLAQCDWIALNCT